MKQFTSHIDYLLQKHDCVIIPDFGGFVLSRESAFVMADGTIRPPQVVVGFNPELRYNDGLIAASYMNVYEISYDAASRRIRDNVTNLNNALNQGQAVQIGNVGRLKLGENKQLRFMPNQHISLHNPETYGLSLAKVKPLTAIMSEQVSNDPKIAQKKKIQIKDIFTGAAAAAAAILVFFVTSTPINQEEQETIQQSGFVTNSLFSSSIDNEGESHDIPSEVETNEYEPLPEEIIDPYTIHETDLFAEEIITEASKVSLPQTTISTSQLEQPKADTVLHKPGYHIIIASVSGEKEANKSLAELKAEGYTTAKINTSDNKRYRISVNSFDNKKEAEKYLSQFRINNPKLRDAWILAN